jgi:hypothetical protein
VSAARFRITVAVLVSALVLAACGGDGADTETARTGAETEVSPAVLAKANANCRRLLRDVRRVGKDALRGGYPSTKVLATEGFFAPGIRLVKQIAERQQRLGQAIENPDFRLYLSLFDPIVVLAEQSLRSTRAGEEARSKKLEGLLEGLGRDQRRAARLAGLHACDVDFLNAMVNAAFRR